VPSLAFADFRFTAQNRANNFMCIYCAGPWFRLGFSGPLSNAPVRHNFYTAETTIFSPFGQWGCGVKVTSTLECNWKGTLPAKKIAFCVSDLPGVEVNLVINPDQSITVDKPTFPCTDSAAFGFLGNSPAGQYGEGAYRFAGKAGETVTVTLDRDGARGSEGEIAQLSIGQEGGASLKSSVGAVPITFIATLPKTGNYDVTVAYPPAATTGTSLRGYYQLDVTATSGDTVLLEPINP
jgi:hypothetical protein